MVTRLKDPCISINDAERWLELRDLANATRVLKAVEVKAYYVFGLIHDIGQCVSCLMAAPKAWPDKYLPALSIFASAVELMGRCLIGNQTDDVNENLRVGFFYLAHPTEQPPPKCINSTQYQDVVVTTEIQYTVNDLVALRNYGAHGQATIKSALPPVDNQLLEALREPFAKAIETYWTGLQYDKEYCVRMGEAKMMPYANRAEPLKNIIDLAARNEAMSDWAYSSNWSVI